LFATSSKKKTVRKKTGFAMTYDTKVIAREMAEFAAGTARVGVEAGSMTPQGVLVFHVTVPAGVSDDMLASLCGDWAELIRKSVPDRPDYWSTSILVSMSWGQKVGLYAVGWAGHQDTWLNDDMSAVPDSQEWQNLHQRLDEYLGARGTSDWQGRGDYFLFDEPSGYADQSLTIYRIEFLTPDLVSGIQEILKDGYADWSVYVVLDLIPPVDGIESDGLQIFEDRVVERWDRALMVERLGERLKV
jgi:hypothetical protein